MAFVAGAGIAGFGGGLLASFNGQANYQANFTFYVGLVWLVLVITAGYRSVQAAIISGITFYVFPEVLDRLFSWPGNYLASHPDVSGVSRSMLNFVKPEWSLGSCSSCSAWARSTYARHPEGIIEAQTSMSIRRINGIVERVKRRKGTAAGGHGADQPGQGERMIDPARSE